MAKEYVQWYKKPNDAWRGAKTPYTTLRTPFKIGKQTTS